jgi:hypothetical protein
MAGSVTTDVFESQALILLHHLKAEGFEFQVVEPDILRVRPVDRVTPELRADLQRHKSGLLMLIRMGDAGVQERRDVFTRQLVATPTPQVPAFLYRPDVPYVKGKCFSCRDLLPEPRFGRCWRCSLAWRLAAGVSIDADLATALDAARVCA